MLGMTISKGNHPLCTSGSKPTIVMPYGCSQTCNSYPGIPEKQFTQDIGGPDCRAGHSSAGCHRDDNMVLPRWRRGPAATGRKNRGCRVDSAGDSHTRRSWGADDHGRVYGRSVLCAGICDSAGSAMANGHVATLCWRRNGGGAGLRLGETRCRTAHIIAPCKGGAERR